MTAIDPTAPVRANDDARRARIFTRIGRADPWLRMLGLAFVTPILRALAGDNPKVQARETWNLAGVPLTAILVFLALWAGMAPRVETSLGAIPGPVQVWDQAVALHQDARAEAARRDQFFADQAERNAQFIADGEPERVRERAYTGRPTFYQQIWTSIKTVFFGFLIGTLIAVPLGILSGMSTTANAALNPFVQIFKPVSPLAWLPIVTIVVSAVYAGGDGSMPRSFIISAITVTLCSLWPTLINTALGVASIDKELINVSKVLKLSLWTRITKLVLPSALPLIFTGLRLSLGVGWMVLIAAEMLAQNPGLGKFVWDEFQNGSQQSLARIMVAVLTIGITGFILDRMMFAIQQAFTYSSTR